MFGNIDWKKQIYKIYAWILSLSVFLAGGWLLQIPKSVEAAKTIIVTIDPGHGGTEKGAFVKYNGRIVCEKDINMKIARYLKKELETYKNVKVYLTRNGDYTVSLDRRVQIAKNYHSNLLFSVHNNAAGPAASYHDGACALISSGQYHKELSTVTATIGKIALERISSSVGMVNRGYLKRLSTARQYPNKKPADYYAIVRGGTEAGFAAMILEHGFVDNKKELKRLLQTSVQKKLGKADARSIANYYGLAKKNGSKKYKKLGPDIKMITRFWMLKDGKYYYVNSKEKIITGWVKIQKKNYHFNADGSATTGFRKMNEDYYYFNRFGKVQSGWKKIRKSWYYFKKSGKALKNCKKKIKNKTYRFAKNGKCLNYSK